MISLQCRLSDGVQLVQKRGNKASGSSDVLLGCGVFGRNLVHQKSCQHRQDLVGSVSGEEAAGDGAHGAAGLPGSLVDSLERHKDIYDTYASDLSKKLMPIFNSVHSLAVTQIVDRTGQQNNIPCPR